MSTIRISFSTIEMDQSVPWINATQKLFESSYVARDEWNFDQN